MADDPLYIAIDLGAGGGRVFLAGVAPGEFTLDEVCRFGYPPAETEGHLRWDFPKILDDVKAGLVEAGNRSRELCRPIQSVGVDSWGVDYGLVDAERRLIENPICYRDPRTQGVMERVCEIVSREEIFERTGIQFLPFNTLFQLCAHAKDGIPEKAAKLLMIPDLINLSLTGKAVTEHTNATTTQMLNASSGIWDLELLQRLGLPCDLLAEVVATGTDLGTFSPALAKALGLGGVRVVAPATHDTASAVVGTPLRDGWAYISSGTWSLVGVERHNALINSEAVRQNFTNEGGAFGTVRFLKNVMGLWILESCRKEWKKRGFEVDYANLLDKVESDGDPLGLIFPDDARFLNPPSMLDAITEQMAENDQRLPADPSAVAKVILDSLAFRYASVLRAIESLTSRKIRGVHIVGGGSQNDYLNQATATVTGLPVLAGPVEATAAGNVLVQAIAAGGFTSMSEARENVAHNVRLKSFSPRPTRTWEEATRRYEAIEAQYAAHHYRER